MNQKHLKFSVAAILCVLTGFGFILGCKSTQLPNGPYDVPTVTPTVTNTFTPTTTPTPTSTLGPVNVSCYVNYGGSQTGVSWNLVDPNGNTINTTTQSSGGTPFLFTPTFDGIYSVNIPTQSRYLYSSQPLTIAGAGNYAVTFSCLGQTLSTNPTSFGYSSSVGYQTPVTVSYSYTGNLDVPVSITTSGLASAFSVLPSYMILNTSGTTSSLTVTKNSCDVNSTSLNFTGFDLLGGTTGASSSIGISKNYSIPVSVVTSMSYSNTTHSIPYYSGNIIFSFAVNDSGFACVPYNISCSNVSLNIDPTSANFSNGSSLNLGNGQSGSITYTYSDYCSNGVGCDGDADISITFTLPTGAQFSVPVTLLNGNATPPQNEEFTNSLLFNMSY